MAAAEILAPQPGEKELDLAAAPGGKATHLAALMKNTGLLVANEIHPNRVWDLVENLERCGATNAIVTNDTPQRMADHFGEYFDRVMLDAPCSGEGMFRKSEIARREWKPELVRSCALRQTAILEQAARMVLPGGSLAYTTCTFSADENERVIANFLTRHPEFDLATVQLAPGYQPAKPEWIGLDGEDRINRAIRIWPHLTHGEGHFIALLKKNVSPFNLGAGKHSSEISDDRILKPRITLKTNIILESFCRENLAVPFDNSRLIQDGTYVYHLPEIPTNLSGLKVIRSGWWLGSIDKERFTPSHSLALGITAAKAKHILPLRVGDRRLTSYLIGESFADTGENGWILITVDDFPIGWGKRVQNVMKNFYPRGLRRFS